MTPDVTSLLTCLLSARCTLVAAKCSHRVDSKGDAWAVTIWRFVTRCRVGEKTQPSGRSETDRTVGRSRSQQHVTVIHSRGSKGEGDAIYYKWNTNTKRRLFIYTSRHHRAIATACSPWLAFSLYCYLSCVSVCSGGPTSPIVRLSPVGPRSPCDMTFRLFIASAHTAAVFSILPCSRSVYKPNS